MKGFLLDMKQKQWIYRIIVILFMLLVYCTDNRYRFLILNVGLAYVPLEISYFYSKHIKSTLLAVVSFIAWLLFYPNSFYMLTDFFHLSAVGMSMSNPIVYFHFSLLAAGVMLGLFLGLESLDRIVQGVKRKFHSDSLLLSGGFYLILSILTAYAIYLGRIMRLHTIHLVTDLPATLELIRSSFTSDMYNFVFMLSILHLLVVVLYQLSRKSSLKPEKIS